MGVSQKHQGWSNRERREQEMLILHSSSLICMDLIILILSFSANPSQASTRPVLLLRGEELVRDRGGRGREVRREVCSMQGKHKGGLPPTPSYDHRFWSTGEIRGVHDGKHRLSVLV